MELRRRRRLGTIAALSTIALASCRPAATPRHLAIDDTAVRRSAADDASTAPPRTEPVTITVDGRRRNLIVHVPGPLTVPRALVFNLHGSGSTAAVQEESSEMDRVADQSGFIVVYPEAGIPLGGGFAWNVPGQPLADGSPVPADAADDVAFFVEAVTALGPRYNIDRRRVFVTGMSGGARMASQLGCDLPTVVAAVAPVSGLRFPAPCRGRRPIPVLSFHGTADAVNPYAGGGPPYWTYGVASAAQQWAVHDGCAATPAVSHPAAAVDLTSYSGCADSSTVALYTIAGAGHEWPRGAQQTSAIDASTIMWAFFSVHPMPP